jgi:hypothetical protein
MDLNCPTCSNEKRSYSEEYDAYYCDFCNSWLEDTCGDSDCEYCNNRPEKPLKEEQHGNS